MQIVVLLGSQFRSKSCEVFMFHCCYDWGWKRNFSHVHSCFSLCRLWCSLVHNLGLKVVKYSYFIVVMIGGGEEISHLCSPVTLGLPSRSVAKNCLENVCKRRALAVMYVKSVVSSSPSSLCQNSEQQFNL